MSEEQLTFIDPIEQIALLTKQNAELRAENEQLTAIYHAAEEMAKKIGFDGEWTFNTQDPWTQDLMDAFFLFDGSTRKATITSDPEKEAMSKDYECRVSHVIQNGETTISVKCRVGPPYRGDMAITVKRAKRAETAAMRALKSFLVLD